MSAYQVAPKHIAAIVGSAYSLFANYLGSYNDSKAHAMAAQLAAENATSVGYRYRETVAPVDVSERAIWAAYRRPLAPGHLLKAVHGLEYQCCEHDGWEKSEAYAFLRQVERFCINTWAEYQESPWSI